MTASMAARSASGEDCARAGAARQASARNTSGTARVTGVVGNRCERAPERRRSAVPNGETGTRKRPGFVPAPRLGIAERGLAERGALQLLPLGRDLVEQDVHVVHRADR